MADTIALLELKLPTELWLRIAQFIPDTDMYRLASVNHLFLDIAEDRRYRDLVIDDDRPEVLLRKLAKLQDPNTARRVRSLEIHPRAIRSAWLKSQSQSRSRSTASKRTIGCLNIPFFQNLNPFKPTPPSPSPSSPSSSSSLASPSIPTTLLTALSNPHIHIKAYKIHWPSSTADELAFALPLLAALWLAIDAPRNLRSLSFDMRVEHLAELLVRIQDPEGKGGGTFGRVERLELGLCVDGGEGVGSVPALVVAQPAVASGLGSGSSPLTSIPGSHQARTGNTTTSPNPNPDQPSPTSPPTPTSAPTSTNDAFLPISKFILSLSSSLTSLTLSSSSSSSDPSSRGSKAHVDFSPLFEDLMSSRDTSSSCDETPHDTFTEKESSQIRADTIPLPYLTHLTLRTPIEAAATGENESERGQLAHDTGRLSAFLKAQSGTLKVLSFESALRVGS